VARACTALRKASMRLLIAGSVTVRTQLAPEFAARPAREEIDGCPKKAGRLPPLRYGVISQLEEVVEIPC
jgi:hypothetical protein